MKNFTMESLAELKKAVDAGVVSQKINVQNVNSFVVEDYCERRKKYEDIKDYIESRVQGITVEVTGGYNKPDAEEPDGMKYDPIIITTYKNDNSRSYSKIKMDGFYMSEPNHAKLVYDTYLDFIVSGNKYIDHGTIAFYEAIINEAIDNTCLSECGFTAGGNSLCLFKEEQMYTIISDIDKEVEGVITTYLPGEEEPSMLIICKDMNVLLSDDCFYIDAAEKTVA